LIGPDDPAPFELINEQGSAPFLLVCDHASRAIPAAMQQLGVADWVLDKHVACDIGAAALTRSLAKRFDAPAVLAGYSRLIVDLNRQLDNSAAFVKVSDGIAIPGNIDMRERERQQRIDSFFTPYHDAVSAQLARFTQRGQVPALLSIHTCTPVFNSTVRRWHIGVMWDEDPRIAQPLMENLARDYPDICVGDNEPYSGKHPHDFTVDYHAERKGYPCVGIEVRQDLVDHQEGADIWAGILGDAFAGVLANPELYQLRVSH
jgi:predicted N-formylglutamate amidohydrolase